MNTQTLTIVSGSLIAEGTRLLRDKRYESAIQLYIQALLTTPALAKTISVNIEVARNRYQYERQSFSRQRVAVCGWELAHNAAERVHILANLYETFAEVEIIGAIFPKYGRELWGPIRNANLPRHTFVVEDQNRFIEQAIDLVSSHPYDIVHLSQPRAPNIFFGILYKLIWGSKVLVDIHDEELAFVGVEESIKLSDYLNAYRKLPDLQNLAGQEWTRIAIGMAHEFDGITVSNPALQHRYGGEIIPHVRDDRKFQLSPELTAKLQNIVIHSHKFTIDTRQNLSQLLQLTTNKNLRTLLPSSNEVSIPDEVKTVASTVAKVPTSSANNTSTWKLLVEESVTVANTLKTVDIIVPVFNALDDVKFCLQSLHQHQDSFTVTVIVVNDGSTKEVSEWLRAFCKDKPHFKLIEHASNQGYTKAVNTGLRASTGQYIVTQNSDTIVAPGWLTGLIRCMNSSPKLGIVGPLSNAASWQNVPSLYDQHGAFAVNDLPTRHTVASMARIVADASTRTYPRLPFVNGFCFMIKREVIDTIGYMDEENFPVGYGEENDYCMRAADSGFEMAIADDVYVFHAKSKSFGHDRRKELSRQGTESLKRKHTPEKYLARVNVIKQTQALDEVRTHIQQALKSQQQSEGVDLTSMRVLFLLPVKGGGGGAHSVVQEVTEMRRLGLNVHVGVRHEHIAGFLQSYQDIANAAELFVGFNDTSLLDIAEDYNIVVATIFSSMELVKRIVESNPHILPAYYVQDYEPMFFPKGSEKWKQAHDSYTMVPGAFLFAKTQWIIQQVRQEHGVAVHKVVPSIDHVVYKPRPRTRDGRIHVAAMIRPQTPRRGADRTMRVLSRLYRDKKNQLAIHLFGCADDSREFQALLRDFPYTNHGPLKRPEVAALLADGDLFIDLSDYQAFGRTALEAMACGCAAVVPQHGGADEYAVHGENALVVDTLDEEQCFTAIKKTLDSPRQLQQLQHNGLLTASRYSVHGAAVSECLPLAKAMADHRASFPKLEKPSLILIPSLRADGMPAGSGYVRVLVPYCAAAIRKLWRVRLFDQTLPAPATARAALIQGDATAFTLEHLKNWHVAWKQADGKLIYEIDDDLLNAASMKQRGYKGDTDALRAKVIFLASAADVVTVSTEPLAKIMRQFNTNVHLIPNSLDADLWQLNKLRDHTSGPYARNPNGPIRIGYIGTHTHDADLDLIAPSMQAIQKKYGNRVEIEVIGGFQYRPPMFGKRVGLPKKTDYLSFAKWLQERVHWDIGVIPLANDDFNDSKSNLKFLEYAALDMSIVVSNIGTYRNIAIDGFNCLTATNSTESWISNVSRLIEDGDVRVQLASQARLDVQNGHVLQNHSRRFELALESVMNSN